MSSELDGIEADVLRDVTRGETLGAHALLFLLRRYALGRAELADTAGRALAVALDTHLHDSRVIALAQWLELFVEAGNLSDDQRFVPVIDRLVTTLRASWDAMDLETAATAIGGCLRATSVEGFESLAADAIDRLEHRLGHAYRPGQSIGSAADQVRTASALLAAYGLSGRLPYSMLAEELIQSTVKEDFAADFVTSCEAVRVLCRLAALHRDADYRNAAIVAPDADYRRDAERLLARQSVEAHQRGAAGAIYAVALLELESADFL